MNILPVRLLAAVVIALLAGKAVSRAKLPSILGWLIAGMALGPHALSLMSQQLLDTSWYQTVVHILECSVGLMIGTELVWKKIRKSGKSIIITTLTQSLGTFFLVSLVFSILFFFSGIPVYLGAVFGGIALATAPAPALSIVREFRTTGPVTGTLIPMAALDDMVGCVVFFVTIAAVAGKLSAGELPVYLIILVVILPLVIGIAAGIPAGILLKKERGPKETLTVLGGMILVVSAAGFAFNQLLLPRPILNFMLIGMAFSATFSNMVPEKRLQQIMDGVQPILGMAMVVVILNLGAPLDYHLIMGAGLFTAVYILARGAGKYLGAYCGAAVTGSPETVKKYLGLTLLPHSGVSLVFTGIAVSVLTGPAPECAGILQGTIAAAAVINEILAVIAAKKGFEWAGELEAEEKGAEKNGHIVITISRQHGSGGREIGRRTAEQLGIPFYDREIIEMAAKNSAVDASFFENSEEKGTGGILGKLSADVYVTLPVADQVFLQQAKVIRELADQGSCVIVGRCGDAVLKDRPQVLRVFVCGDLESRRGRVENIYGESAEILEKTEKKRSAYYQYYTGRKFGEAQNYDICLNSGTLGVDECVKAVTSAFRSREIPVNHG